jgi:septal ring factor EnvC (AmiA/AmiB activator)
MERTNKRKKKNRLIRAVICAAAVIAGLVFLISCKSSDEGEPGIRILISEQTMQDGTIIQIPEFKADREETQKNIRDLEKETKNQLLTEAAQKAQENAKILAQAVGSQIGKAVYIQNYYSFDSAANGRIMMKAYSAMDAATPAVQEESTELQVSKQQLSINVTCKFRLF